MLRHSTPLSRDIRRSAAWLVLRVSLGSLWLDVGWRSLHGRASSGDDLAVAQTLAGIALILGLLTGLAAAVGAVLSADLLLTDRAPVVTPGILLAVWLVITWRTAGAIGFDRWVVPALTARHGKRRGRGGNATGG